MNVVWAYADWSEEGKSPIHTKSYNRFLLEASVRSVIQYAPWFTRIFYVNQTLYDLLKELRWLKYWHRVEVVDFKQKLQEDRATTFFALPKVWAYTQQEEPFWIFDTDVMFIRDISEWFDPNYLWVDRYDFMERAEMLENTQQVDPTGLSNPRASAVGAPIFFPNPKIANIIGHAILDFNVETVRISENLDNFKEEGILGGLTQLFCQPERKLSDGGQEKMWHRPEDGDLEDYPEYVESIKQVVDMKKNYLKENTII